MISFYTGTPGSGKSFHLAQLVYDKLRWEHVNVIANFEINLDNVSLTRLGYIKSRITELSRGKIKFKKYNKTDLVGKFYYWDNSQITVSNLLSFAQEHHKRRLKRVDQAQTVVLIDEAGIVFNCRGFSDRSRNEWVRFMAKHRHYNFDVVLACQYDRQVDKQIRCCVEYEQVHRKLSNYQLLGKLFSFFAGGNIFVICENWYMAKLKVGNHILRYSPRIASLYDTLRDFDDDLGRAADAPPPGVGGDRGPTAPAPVQSPAAPASSDNQPADQPEQPPAAEPETLEAKFARWKSIMNK